MTKLSDQLSTLTELEQEYIHGFEDGCSYLFSEVIMWERNNQGQTVADLIEFFKKSLERAKEKQH